MESKLAKLFKLDKLFDSVSHYVEARLNLFKLEAKEEIAGITSKGIQAVIVVFMFSFALLFLSLSGALFLGIWLDNYAYGFLIVGGAYLIISIILYIFKDKLGIRERINDYLGNVTEEDNE